MAADARGAENMQTEGKPNVWKLIRISKNKVNSRSNYRGQMNKGKEGESLWHSEHLPEYFCCSCSLETMCSRAAAKLSCLLLHRFEKHRKAKPFMGTWAVHQE